jgi:galactokinase
MITGDLIQKFLDVYGGDPAEISAFFAPGRVNLIGEHTDYNYGYVLPCSLQFGTYLLARPTIETKIKFKSLNFPVTATVCVGDDFKPIGKEWMNYPLGVMQEFKKKKLPVPGMELMYWGNIPNGAGLSSSASIEIVTAFAIDYLMQTDLPKKEIIKMAQTAENEFVGMKCGIMDQFAVMMGRTNHAVFLNCDTLEFELIPLILGNYKLVISNTNKRRELTETKYNERRSECENAVEILNQEVAIDHLSQIGVAEFHKLEEAITDQVIKRRAQHVIFENERVLSAVNALRADNLDLFGQYMVESHHSLRDDYEVSCFELDTLVEEALNVKGVIGSRMTGGGFGGCTISLVHMDQIETFKTLVGKNYAARTGLQADFYISGIGDGAKRIIL